MSNLLLVCGVLAELKSVSFLWQKNLFCFNPQSAKSLALESEELQFHLTFVD